MKKYIVSGKTTAFISVKIEAESKEEAMKKLLLLSLIGMGQIN